MKKNPLFGIIDIETTGHDPLRRITLRKNTAEADNVLIPWHEITEIACVFATNPELEVVGQTFSMVKPEHPERCDPATIPVTNFPERYKNGEWDHAFPLKEAIVHLLEDCRKMGGGEGIVMPGGQNWFFDWSFLFTAFAWIGIPDEIHSKILSYKRFDTASMAIQELWDQTEPLDIADFSLRGGKLQEKLGIAPEPKPHRAHNGAEQALAVLRKLSEIKSKRLFIQ